MHKQYAQDGLEVIAVSLDNPEDASARESAQSFLRSMRPRFPTFLLEGGPQSLPREFSFNMIPAVFVVDRAGQARKVDVEDVERVVRGYLKR